MTVAHPVEAGRQGVLRPSGAPPLLRVAGLALALGFAFPGVYLVYRNFAEGADPAGLLISDRTLGPLWRSVRLAVSVSGAALVLGTALAWLTTRTDLAWRRLWRVLLPLPLVFPTFVGAAAFIHTLNPGGLANDLLAGIGLDRTPELRGFYGAWLVLTLMTYPYVYLPVAARLRQLPGSLEESARVLGETALKVFGRICLPQIATAMGAGTLLVFLYTLSDFGAVQLMRYDTLTRAIATNQLANPPVALALSLLLLVLAALVVLAERRFSRSLPDAATVQSSRPMVYDLGRWRVPALGFVALSAGAGVGAPLVALVDWAARGLVRSATGGRSLTIDGAKVLEATTNTLGASLVAAVSVDRRSAAHSAAGRPVPVAPGFVRARRGREHLRPPRHSHRAVDALLDAAIGSGVRAAQRHHGPADLRLHGPLRLAGHGGDAGGGAQRPREAARLGPHPGRRPAAPVLRS